MFVRLDRSKPGARRPAGAPARARGAEPARVGRPPNLGSVRWELVTLMRSLAGFKAMREIAEAWEDVKAGRGQ